MTRLDELKERVACLIEDNAPRAELARVMVEVWAEVERHAAEAAWLVYAEACPRWASDGRPESMAANARRYREGLEAEASDLRCEVAQLKEQRARIERERARLSDWLRAIEGGDEPITDEAELRQMAYEAVVLGHPSPDGDA